MYTLLCRYAERSATLSCVVLFASRDINYDENVHGTCSWYTVRLRIVGRSAEVTAMQDKNVEYFQRFSSR